MSYRDELHWVQEPVSAPQPDRSGGRRGQYDHPSGTSHEVDPQVRPTRSLVHREGSRSRNSPVRRSHRNITIAGSGQAAQIELEVPTGSLDGPCDNRHRSLAGKESVGIQSAGGGVGQAGAYGKRRVQVTGKP